MKKQIEQIFLTILPVFRMFLKKGHCGEGFTLVELLASIIVLIVVGAIITGTISSTLRGTNKTNTIENIRQNGNYALNQMSKDIEYAQSFDGKNTGLSRDGVNYETSCPFSSSPTPSPVVTAYNYIAVQSLNNVVTRYKCTSSELTAEGIYPVKPETSLIDVTNVTSVVLSNCSLQCIQSKSTDVPIIKISFSIGPKNSNILVENSSSSILFETSVTMRNYEK